MTVEPEKASPGSSVLGRLTAKIDDTWHLYSLTTPKGGANPTTIELAPSPAVSSWKVYQPKPVTKFDPNFQIDTETYDKEVVFIIRAELSKDAKTGPVDLTVNIRYQACTETQCLNPARRQAAGKVTITAGPIGEATAIPAGYIEFTGQRTPSKVKAAQTAPPTTAGMGWGLFLAVAFVFGIGAIFTPCVFPMIPITMSFFLNQPETTRAGAVRQALIFCAGIVVLFTGLGIAVTAALGPFGVVQLGSNAWVNGFISLVFFAFGLSLLGAFEITLPSGLLTRLNQASEGGGVLATLLMGLTFALTSFACIGPFIGPLLAASVQGDKLQPALGMAMFATGLASPFFFLALFPTYLKRLPKSGGWLARVKVVLGFVVLAAMLKYAANVDQVLQWNVVTRERFLAMWFVLFGLAGLYLIGLLRLPGVKPDDELGVGRLLVAVLLLGFAFSLLPGMFGSRLGEIEAYVPPPAQGFGGGSTAAESGLKWMKNSYKEALEKARQENKTVFVAFTGYACSNCHWMKANMFPRPEIASALAKHVLVELYTDGTDAASEENQKLQETKFSTVSIPFYAIVDKDENVIDTFASGTRDVERFRAFVERLSL